VKEAMTSKGYKFNKNLKVNLTRELLARCEHGQLNYNLCDLSELRTMVTDRKLTLLGPLKE
jgi:uncharacterized lipoprotein YajG